MVLLLESEVTEYQGLEEVVRVNLVFQYLASFVDTRSSVRGGRIPELWIQLLWEPFSSVVPQ